MNTEEYLKQVAYVEEPSAYLGALSTYRSNFDGSFITSVGFEKEISQLAELEITEQLTHGVGFSPKDGKWYGWSHRAICGFKVGDTCKKGQPHYIGSTLKEQEEAAILFWSNDGYDGVHCKGVFTDKGHKEKYFLIQWKYKGKTQQQSHYIKPIGRGEWTAKTLDDAKQMAIDFNEGVS